MGGLLLLPSLRLALLTEQSILVSLFSRSKFKTPASNFARHHRFEGLKVNNMLRNILNNGVVLARHQQIRARSTTIFSKLRTQKVPS